jgi:type I restriction enzyme M protein
MPTVRATLFESAGRPGYAQLTLPITEVKSAILQHPEFQAFQREAAKCFETWTESTIPQLSSFTKKAHPKALIETIAEELLVLFRSAPLLNAYDVYQHLMDYWAETMQDDCYLIAADGWVANTTRIVEPDKKGKPKDKGWQCDLVPKDLIVSKYFSKKQAALDAAQLALDAASASIAELEEEHGSDEGYLGSLDKISKADVNARLKELKGDNESHDEQSVLKRWIELTEQESAHKRSMKEHTAALDKLAYEKYPALSMEDVKSLVIEDKWMTRLSHAIHGELDRVSQTLTGRIRELAERYAAPLPKLEDDVEALSEKVEEHLKKMGASWT